MKTIHNLPMRTLWARTGKGLALHGKPEGAANRVGGSGSPGPVSSHHAPLLRAGPSQRPSKQWSWGAARADPTLLTDLQSFQTTDGFCRSRNSGGKASAFARGQSFMGDSYPSKDGEPPI